MRQRNEHRSQRSGSRPTIRRRARSRASSAIRLSYSTWSTASWTTARWTGWFRYCNEIGLDTYVRVSDGQPAAHPDGPGYRRLRRHPAADTRPRRTRKPQLPTPSIRRSARAGSATAARNRYGPATDAFIAAENNDAPVLCDDRDRNGAGGRIGDCQAGLCRWAVRRPRRPLAGPRTRCLRRACRRTSRTWHRSPRRPKAPASAGRSPPAIQSIERPPSRSTLPSSPAPTISARWTSDFAGCGRLTIRLEALVACQTPSPAILGLSAPVSYQRPRACS